MVEQSLALFAEGLALFVDLGDRRMVALALEGVAGLAGRGGNGQRAARLFGAASAVQEASGLPVEPAYRDAHQRDVDAARAALGEAPSPRLGMRGRAATRAGIAEATALPRCTLAQRRSRGSPDKATAFVLTSRELDVLRLIADGRTDKEIGAALFISHRTVMNHVAHILAKLDVPSRAAAAREAARRDLL